MRIHTIISCVVACVATIFAACSNKSTEPLAAVDLIPMNNAYYTLDGKLAFEGDFEYADFFSDGLAKVLSNGEVIFINKKGEKVFEAGECYSVTGFWNGIAWKMTKAGHVALDTDGNELFTTTLDPITMFNASGKALVRWKTDDRAYAYGVIDRNGNVTELKGDFVIYGSNSRVIHSDRIIVNWKPGGKPAVIDMQGKIIVEPGIYSDIEPFDLNGNAIVRKNGAFGIIDKDGRELFMDTENKYAFIEYDGDWYRYSLSGRQAGAVYGDEKGNIKTDVMPRLRFNGSKYAFHENKRYDRNGDYIYTDNKFATSLIGGKIVIAYNNRGYYLCNEKGEKLSDDVLVENIYGGIYRLILAGGQGHSDALVLGFPYVETFWGFNK